MRLLLLFVFFFASLLAQGEAQQCMSCTSASECYAFLENGLCNSDRCCCDPAEAAPCAATSSKAPTTTTNTTEAPATTTEASATTTEASATTTEEPATSTEAPATTTDATTSSTTTPLPCSKCPTLNYMETETCDLPEVNCDVSLLMTAKTPCAVATCTAGSKMYYNNMENEETFSISNSGVRCRTDGVSFEDASDPSVFFEAASGSVVCVKQCEPPPAGPGCTNADVFVAKTCKWPAMTPSERKCYAPHSLFINDVAVEGSLTCVNGFWKQADGTQLADGFTAYCKEKVPA